MKTQHRNLMVLPVLLIFLAANVTMVSLPIHVLGDVITQERWGKYALENSITWFYGKNSAVDYPPFYMYAFYFNAWLEYHFSQNHAKPVEPGALSYVIISKMIPLLCNLLIGLLLYFTLKKGGVKKAIIGSSLYLFNPAIMFNTSYWGQVDSVYTVFLLLTVKSLIDKRYFLSTLWTSLAILTKVQAFFFLPILGLVLISNLRVKRILELIIGNATIVFVVMLPFLPVTENIVNAIMRSFSEYPFVSVNALNFWFLLFRCSVPEYTQCTRDTYTPYGISLKMVGYLAFGIFTALVLYQIRRGNKSIALGSASLAFAFFMLPTEIHERYLFPFFALFLLVVLEKKKHIGIYAILTMTYLLNMMVAVNFNVSHLTFYWIQISLTEIVRYGWLDNFTFVIAAVNVLVFMYFSAVGIFDSLIKNLRQDLLVLNRRIVENWHWQAQS